MKITLAMLVTGIVFSPFIASLAAPGFHFSRIGHGTARPMMATVKVACVASVVAMTLGVPFALIVDRSRSAVRRSCWMLALLALIVPPYIVAESAIILFGPTGKLSRGMALMFGWGPHVSDTLGRARYAVPGYVFTPVAAGAVLGGCLFPIVALATAAANRRTDRRIHESARLMRGRWGVVAVALRLLLPSAVGAALLVFALALTECVVPQLLRVGTIGERVYELIQSGELADAAGANLPLLPCVLAAGGLGALMIVRARAASLAGTEGEIPKFTGKQSGVRTDCTALLMTVLATAPALLVPVVGLGWLMSTSRLPEKTSASHRVLRASGFFDSLRGAWEIAQDDAIRTILLAMLTATVSLVLGLWLARSVQRTRWNGWLGVLGAGLAIPAPVVGLGLIVLWNRASGVAIYNSVVIVILAWMARFLPVAVLLSQAALTRVPVDLEHAAALCGRGPLRRFMGVVIPHAAPGLVATWLAVYVLSATEFAATLLIVPPGRPVLAPSVVNLMRRGQDSEIAACQVLLLLVVAAPLAIIATTAIIRSRLKEKP